MPQEIPNFSNVQAGSTTTGFKTRDVPYIGPVDFPGDMSEEQIQVAIKRISPPPPPIPGFLQVHEDVATGIGQKALSVAQGVGQWAADIPRQVKDVVARKQSPFSIRNAKDASPAYTDPQGTYAWSGRTPLLTETGKNPLEATNFDQRVGQVLGELGINSAAAIATGGASIPTQVAVQGATAGILAGTAQEPRNAQAAAVVGGAIPYVSGFFSKRLASWLENKAQKNVAAAIGPRSMAEKEKLGRVLPEVTATKPFALSQAGLLKKFSKHADDAVAEIDKAIDAAGQGQRIVNTQQIARKLESLKSDLLIDGKIILPEHQKAMDALSQVQNEIRALGEDTSNDAIESLLDKLLGGGGQFTNEPINPEAGKATLNSIRKLKTAYGNIVSGVQDNFFKNTLDEVTRSRAIAAKEGYFALQEGLTENAPITKELGKKAQQAITVRGILDTNITKDIGKSSALNDMATSAFIASRRPLPAIVYRTVNAFMASPAFKLAKAGLQTTLANALKSGDANAIAQAMNQIINETIIPPPSAPPQGQ